MRGNSIGLMIGGVLMLAAGAGMIVLGWTVEVARVGLWIGGGALVLGAFVLFGAGRWLGGIGGSRLRAKGGLPGTARVLAVHDTGVTVNELTAIFRIEAEISVPGRAPYTGSFRIPVGRTQWGAIQPGMSLPVLVDPDDPATIAYDDAPRPSVAATPGSVQTRSARDVVVRGHHATATVLGAQLTGRTAGELATTALPADQADDPVAIVQLRVEPSAGTPFEAAAALRVPDGKQGLLAPGTRVPVAYLPEDPARTTTIDWDRA